MTWKWIALPAIALVASIGPAVAGRPSPASAPAPGMPAATMPDPATQAPAGQASDGTREPDKKRVCYKCRGTGKLEADTGDYPDWLLRDSHFLRNDPNGGVGFAVCDRSPTPEAEAEYRERFEANRKWLSTVLAFEEVTGDSFVHVEGYHLEVLNSIDRLRVRGRRLDRAGAARKYLELLIEAYDRYREVFDVGEQERGPKMRIVLARDQTAYADVMKEHFGRGGEASGYKYTSPQAIWYVGRRLPEADERLEERVVYNFAFLLIYRYHRLAHVPDWLEVGFASWLEHETYRSNRNFSFVEVPPDDAYRSGDNWKKRVKQELLRGTAIPFAAIQDRDLNAFGYREAAFAFAFTDFLIDHDEERFRALVKRLKVKGTKTQEALLEVYGWVPAQLDEAWREWAVREY